MQQRKVYSREFKENAVKLSYERSNLSLFARELGYPTQIFSTTLYHSA